MGIDFVKLIYDGDSDILDGKAITPRQLDRTVMQAIVNRAYELRKRVFAHTGVKHDEVADLVEAGVDGIEHSFVATSDTLLEKMAVIKKRR